MKMDLREFCAFLGNTFKWSSETKLYPEGHSFTASNTKDGKEHDTAWGYIETVNRRGNVTLTWTQSYSYFCNEPSSLEYGDNGGEFSLSLEGVTVVDEDGEEVSIAELEELLREGYEWFTLHDREVFDELDDFNSFEYIGNGPEEETVRRDYRPDVVVHYDGYAGVSSRRYDSREWECVGFYSLENGIFVAYAYHSVWAKVPSLYDGEVFTGENCREQAAEWLKGKVGEDLFDMALAALNKL